MNEEMKFPKTFEEFIKQYSFFDKQQIYTNGSELIQVFRIKQWEEHKERENQELKKQLDDANEKILLLQASEPMLNYKKALEETQQKEFINYLEDEKISPIKCVLNSIDDKNHDYNMFKNKLDNYEEILQKYREIIGE